MQPDELDNAFALAVVRAYVRAHFLVPPDDAAGFAKLLQEATLEPAPPPAREPPALVIPFGCTYYAPERRQPKIVPYMYVQGQKISLGHYPYTEEGAALAARVREAGVAEKERGGDIASIKRVAKEARGETL